MNSSNSHRKEKPWKSGKRKTAFCQKKAVFLKPNQLLLTNLIAI
jgi:hypothetical protein